MRVWCVLAALALSATSAFAQTITETEPNNTPATANRAVLGGKAVGSLNFVNDMGTNGDDAADWWKVDASAGQMIFAKVAADEYGSYLDSRLGLFASDGTRLAGNDSWDGFDPYIAFRAPTTGAYYIVITTGPGVANKGSYTINFSEAKCPVSAEEGEPNDSPAQAKTIALGQSIHGYSCPYGDDGGGITNPDYFKIQVQAGTKLQLQVDTVGRERPQFGCACQIAAFMRLLASDGTTTLAQTSEYDYPKRIEYQVTNSGIYYVTVSVWPGGIRYPYTLHVNSTSSSSGGKGNPVTVRADGLGSPIGLIADPFGDFIVSDTAGKQVWWVTTDGRKQVIARDQITVNHGLPWVSPSGIGWDVFANLIMITQRETNKMTPKGTFTVMFSMDDVKGVAQAPDGSLWFAGSDHPAVRHYDPFGTYIETMLWSAANNESTPYLIASSQAGDVYFVTSGPTAPTNVYKVTGKQGQLLFQTSFHAAGLAVDADGNLYFTGDQEGNVYKYSPSGAALENPFASGLDHPTGIAFGRNGDGSMNSRLFVVEGSGRLVELNGGGVAQRGAPIGFATATQATADLLKPGALSDAQRRVLDNVGNKNGRYDVGDLRAFLIQTTTLSPGAPFGAGGKP